MCNVERMKELMSMKAVMKTMKRNIANVKVMGYGLPVIVILLVMALPTMAQPFGNQPVTQPTAVFQSTSVMQGSGSAYSANPILNSDGTAAYSGSSSSTVSGPRRAKMDDPAPSNPFGGQTIGNVGNPNEPGTPIGDALIPLMLFACAYFIWRRRMVRSKMSEECK